MSNGLHSLHACMLRFGILPCKVTHDLAAAVTDSSIDPEAKAFIRISKFTLELGCRFDFRGYGH